MLLLTRTGAVDPVAMAALVVRHTLHLLPEDWGLSMDPKMVCPGFCIYFSCCKLSFFGDHSNGNITDGLSIPNCGSMSIVVLRIRIITFRTFVSNIMTMDVLSKMVAFSSVLPCCLTNKKFD
ncbi:hypothetical protein CHS0354_022803 [Potamilus streckersoni]|uniref:Uncharacterized protein n=1 Tax=Potamilus streckersoni TaxID=2493646 RepID=A0AAE0S1W1_9BIVA|nr:hypothetical protein CHS0354_022803 [Potamilus streckersoni]